jgi:putative oxidoreductase
MFDVQNEKLPRWWGLVPLRLIVGYGYIAHGAAKWTAGPASFGKLLHFLGAPAPFATAWVVMLLEIFGGVAVVAGLFVEIVSVPLIISMLVAMFTVHIRYGFSSIHTIGLTPSGPVFGPPGYEINLLYIGALLALALLGSGPLSLDGWLVSRTRGNRRRGV